MTLTGSARVQAPAKVNLGLEILGRRNDGFHEVRSILAMIELADEIACTVDAESNGISVRGVPGVDDNDNLIVRAVRSFVAATGVAGGHDIAVTKRIPSPAGLGGASSDAAATLLLLNELHGCPLRTDELHALAADLGSDVPFFLASPVAAVSGRGTDLQPLPEIAGQLVIAVPDTGLVAKTAALYGMLSEDDFTDGSTVAGLASRIADGQPLDSAWLGNAFERPLYAIEPVHESLIALMQHAGCTGVSLSGAGPAHFAFFPGARRAEAVAKRLRELTGPNVAVIVTRFRSEPVSVARA